MQFSIAICLLFSQQKAKNIRFSHIKYWNVAKLVSNMSLHCKEYQLVIPSFLESIGGPLRISFFILWINKIMWAIGSTWDYNCEQRIVINIKSTWLQANHRDSVDLWNTNVFWWSLEFDLNRLESAFLKWEEKNLTYSFWI